MKRAEPLPATTAATTGAPPAHAPPPRVRLVPMFPLCVMLGGLELQCLKTLEALKRIGLPAELLDPYRQDDPFDILHLFGSTPNYGDICRYASGRWPIVVSAVSGARGPLRLRAVVWRGVSWMAARARTPTAYTRLRAVYAAAAAVLCLNELEARFLRIVYGVSPERTRIIPNGVEDRYFGASPEPFAGRYGARDFVLFTGHITRRKNPLALARALRDLGLPGVFIGRRFPTEHAYGDAFAEVISSAPRLLWIQGLAHEDPLLASACAAARVFCLPSSAETQSLSALEAMAAGAPVVLGDFAYAAQAPFERCLTCRPDDDASLRTVLRRAMDAPDRHRVPLPDRHRWTSIAREIAAVYRRALDPTP